MCHVSSSSIATNSVLVNLRIIGNHLTLVIIAPGLCINFSCTGYPIEVGCYDGDLGYTDMWSVDLSRSLISEYSTDDFNITECFRDCARRPFIGVVSTNTT